MVSLLGIILLGVLFFVMVVIGLVVWAMMSWNIPVVILRYQGDKRRPQLRITKGRKATRAGVSRLFVRGYNVPIRDFNAENYYPAHKGKHGALLLFEVKPGILTPLIPRKLQKKMNKEELAKFHAFVKQFGEDASAIDFNFDQELYEKIMLEAVDDTDIDFMLQEYSRTDSQYVTGWRDFLNKYGSHLVLVIIAICLLTGFIVWLDKSPDMMATCASAAQEASTNVFREFTKNVVTPPG